MSLRKAGIIIVIFGILALLLFSVTMKNSVKQETCSNIIIDIEDNDKYNFVKKENIISLLNTKGLNPINQQIKNIKLDKIRETIEGNPYVRQARCYFSKSNNLNIEIIQRKPLFRVLNNENYFVDDHRVMVKTGMTIPVYIPVVSGEVTKMFAENELFDLVMYVENDKFLSNLIQQIYVTHNNEIELISIVGNQRIILGKIKESDGIYNFDKKLNRLKKLFLCGAFNHLGWDKYSQIDLRFDRQIVCKKVF